jgi:DNA-binding CsgD family transcriptional regulator
VQYPAAMAVALASLLDLISEVHGVLDLDELIDTLLVVLQRHIPSDFVSINDIGPDTDRVVSLIRPPQPEHLYRAYGEFAFQNPLMARYMETLDGRAYRFSDVISVADYHRLDLYKRVYAPMGVEHQMAFVLPATPGRVLAIALSRSAPDYSNDERNLIDRARPFLIQSWRSAIEHTALRDELEQRPLGDRQVEERTLEELARRGLTIRQAEVLSLVARGRSNRDAGAILGISDRTVQKHLEHCYRALGVNDRSAAAELLWSLATPVPAEQEQPRRGLENHPSA